MVARLLVLMLLAALMPAREGRADESVRAHYRRGLSAYALGNYTLAAAEYEKAFNLDPQPELLYDAAQAHRLAGNRQRALHLYQSYLALFGDKVSNRDEVTERVLALKRALADAEPAGEPKAKSEPPKSKVAAEPPKPIVTAPPPAAPLPPPTVTPPPAPAPQAQPLTVARSPEPAHQRRGHGLAIGLGVAAGAIVIAGAVVLALELGPRNPTPSFGAVTPR